MWIVRRPPREIYTPKPTYVYTLEKSYAVQSQNIMNVEEYLFMKIAQRLLILTCTPLGAEGWFAAVSWFQD